MDSDADQAYHEHPGVRPRFAVRYWGVRGSNPISDERFLRFGGHTTCLEVRIDDALVVIDAGTGIARLGTALDANSPCDATLVFSHYHLDHVIGLPFFGPLYRSSTGLVLVGDPTVAGGPRAALHRLMAPPFFPVDFASLRCRIDEVLVTPGHPAGLAGASLALSPLAHPGGASGIRLSHRGRTFVHLSDLEHAQGPPDDRLVEFCRDADVLSYDAMFDEDLDYQDHAGWGHSTWQAGLALARSAGVRRFVATHHAPQHDDVFMDGVCARLVEAAPSALVAWEGLELDLLTPGCRSHREPPNESMGARLGPGP